MTGGATIDTATINQLTTVTATIPSITGVCVWRVEGSKRSCLLLVWRPCRNPN